MKANRPARGALCFCAFGVLAMLVLPVFKLVRANNCDDRLLKYVEDGNYRLAIRTIESGASANTTADVVGSARRNLFDEFLMAFGAESRRHRYSHRTVLQIIVSTDGGELHFRYQKQSAALVKCLLEHGAKCDEADQDGLTPLWYAVACGRPDVASLLLRAGARPNARAVNYRYGAPILYANTACAALLIQYGADVNARDPSGNTAMHTSDAAESLILLHKGARLNDRNNAGKTPLIVAAYNGWSAKLGMLIGRGAEVDVTDDQGATALHYAAALGTPADITLLIKAGAKVNVRDKGGSTPLGWACAMGRAQAAKALLDHGARGDICDVKGKSAVDFANERSFVPILTLLRTAARTSRR